MNRIARNTAIWAVSIFCLNAPLAKAEDELNMEFLEWLGQTSEIEELGIDVEQWLPEDSQTETNDSAKEKSS